MHRSVLKMQAKKSAHALANVMKDDEEEEEEDEDMEITPSKSNVSKSKLSSTHLYTNNKLTSSKKSFDQGLQNKSTSLLNGKALEQMVDEEIGDDEIIGGANELYPKLSHKNENKRELRDRKSHGKSSTTTTTPAITSTQQKQQQQQQQQNVEKVSPIRPKMIKLTKASSTSSESDFDGVMSQSRTNKTRSKVIHSGDEDEDETVCFFICIFLTQLC